MGISYRRWRCFIESPLRNSSFAGKATEREPSRRPALRPNPRWKPALALKPPLRFLARSHYGNDRLLPMKSDRSFLEAALLGYQAKVAEIQQAMLSIRALLGQAPAAAEPSAKPAKRKMSAAGRRRIAAAQKKRWAEYNKRKAAG